jgi:hypothetical protein
MGHKVVCLTCRKSFSKGLANLHAPENCSECGNRYIFYDQRFRPPKQNDLAAWKVVSFLYEHGFVYQHIYDRSDIDKEYGWGKTAIYGGHMVNYPTSLVDAREFVVKYKTQAIETLVPPSGG